MIFKLIMSSSSVSDNKSPLEEVKSRIVGLNLSKNSYVVNKIKNNLNDSDEKDLIASLIYVIAEIRRLALELGISDDGKINLESPYLGDFNHLNESVKNLKTQILFLTKASIEEIKNEMAKQKDAIHLNKIEHSGSRLSEKRESLQRHLQELKDSKNES
jgi:hypothetical protein